MVEIDLCGSKKYIKYFTIFCLFIHVDNLKLLQFIVYDSKLRLSLEGWPSNNLYMLFLTDGFTYVYFDKGSVIIISLFTDPIEILNMLYSDYRRILFFTYFSICMNLETILVSTSPILIFVLSR